MEEGATAAAGMEAAVVLAVRPAIRVVDMAT